MGKVLTFYLCDGLFGIDITSVKEINRNVDFTPVPGSPPDIAGLLNLRGQIVSLYNLGKMLGYEDKEWAQGAACIILKAVPGDVDHIGFLIDKSGEVVDFEESEYELPPANMTNAEGTFLKGIVKLKSELLRIINPERLF